VLWVAPVLAVLVLGGGYLVYGLLAGKTPASDAADAARLKHGCASSTSTASPSCAQPAVASASGQPGGVRKAVVRRHKPARRRSHPAPHHPSPRHSTTDPASPAPSHPAPTTSAPPSGGQSGSAVAQVLALINQARAQAGLPAYTVSSGLDRSSAAHNQRMASGCGLSHQCPGEPSLGTRETDAGVNWTAAGENIGEGGPEPATAAAIAQLAVTLTQDMLAEKPPDDGHRLNILSSAFHHIGITVQRDGSGTVWMTQDFSN
jgi:uncharacterized protein YkwD